MDLGVKNKTALVLGAGGGLGGAIAGALAREGTNVAVADISKEGLDRVQGEVTAAGLSALVSLGTSRTSR